MRLTRGLALACLAMAAILPTAHSAPVSMSYATPADVAARYGPDVVAGKALGTHDVAEADFADSNHVVTQRVQLALDSTVADIDAAVVKRYGALPWTEHPKLKELHATAAWMWLWEHSKAGFDEQARLDQKRLDRRLADLASGNADLGPLPEDAPPDAVDPYGGTFFRGPERQFGRRA